MGTRLIVLLPLAALATAALLALASSTHGALQRSLAPLTPPGFELVRYESSGDLLQDRLDELARKATTCDLDPSCLDAPLACPIVMEPEREREYERLHRRFENECGRQPYASQGAAHSEASEWLESCGVSQETYDSRPGASERDVYIF